MGDVLGSIGGIIGGLVGGGSAPSSPSVSPYQPRGTATADNELTKLLTSNFNALSGSSNPFSTLSPQFKQAFDQLYSTPGTAGYMAGAGNAGNAYTTAGNNSVNMAGIIDSAAAGALPGAQGVMSMGLDPQKQMYAQLLQQTNDQANVHNAQYGLTGQQAAGNVNQADANFNIDWQNQQLERALKGLSGYNSTLASMGTAGTAAQNIGAAGAGSILSGGATPYTAGQSVGANQETALAQFIAQLLGPTNSTQGLIADLGGYIDKGITASTAGASNNLEDYYAQLAGAQGGAIGGASLANGLSSLFNTQAAPGSSSGGGGGGGGSSWMQALPAFADIAASFF